MRYFFDTEFCENGHTIDLISIGIIAEDGREYYAQSCEFDPRKASAWVRANVLSHLADCPHNADSHIQFIDRHRTGRCIPPHAEDTCPWRTCKAIKQEILAFMNTEQYGKPELWGWYSSYDHVALCQLFGRMIDLPAGWPMYTRDLKQWCDALGNPKLPEQGKDEHHALADARWNKKTYELLKEYELMEKAA